MKKILLIIVPVLLLTGCVSVEINDTNKDYCYRYIDYKNEEHIMSYDDNSCFISNGQMYCRNNDLRLRVMEFEKIKCPKEGE